MEYFISEEKLKERIDAENVEKQKAIDEHNRYVIALDDEARKLVKDLDLAKVFEEFSNKAVLAFPNQFTLSMRTGGFGFMYKLLGFLLVGALPPFSFALLILRRVRQLFTVPRSYKVNLLVLGNSGLRDNVADRYLHKRFLGELLLCINTDSKYHVVSRYEDVTDGGARFERFDYVASLTYSEVAFLVVRSYLESSGLYTNPNTLFNSILQSLKSRLN